MKIDIKEYIYGTILRVIGLIGFEKLFTLVIILLPKYKGYSGTLFFIYGSTSGMIAYDIIFIVIYI